MNAKKEKVYPAYVSKHNSNHEKQVILLMIPILAFHNISILAFRSIENKHGV